MNRLISDGGDDVLLMQDELNRILLLITEVMKGREGLIVSEGSKKVSS